MVSDGAALCLWISVTTAFSPPIFAQVLASPLPSTFPLLKVPNDLHQEANQRWQVKQEVFYDRKAGSDKRHLNNQEPVFVWNALKKIWQQATVLNRLQPTEHSRTYTVDIQGKIYQRTREHLRPRSQSDITPPADDTSLPVSAEVLEHDRKDTHITTRLLLLAEDRPKDSAPTLEQSTSKLPCSEKQVDLQPASTFAASGRTCFQPKSQVKDWACHPGPSPVQRLNRDKQSRVLQMKLVFIDHWVHTDTHETVVVPVLIW